MKVVVRRLLEPDLDRCGWAGTRTHLDAVRHVLLRVPDSADYLLVLDEAGTPVAMGGVDYEQHPGIPVLWQLSTDASRRSGGFGTVLVDALERAAAGRGYTAVRLDVEEDPRAEALYRRLGYEPTGQTELCRVAGGAALGRSHRPPRNVHRVTKDLRDR